jgi:hypothetical protein
MKEAMAAILHPEVSMENKEIAFDNFEQLVEGIDNANNIEALGLWQPLVDLLVSEQGELRKWAAWCMATAVSNNVKAQEKVRHWITATKVTASANANAIAATCLGCNTQARQASNTRPGPRCAEESYPCAFEWRAQLPAKSRQGC